LPDDRSRQIEAHVADCARCQAMTAAFARTEPVAPAVLPFWRRSSVKWLVPLAAAASVSIWIAWPGRKAEVPSSAVARIESSSGAPVEAKPFADKKTDALQNAQAKAPSSTGAIGDEFANAGTLPAKEPRQKSVEREETAAADSSLKQKDIDAVQESRNELAKSDTMSLTKNTTIDGVPGALTEAPRPASPSAPPMSAPAPAAAPAAPAPVRISPSAQSATAGGTAGVLSSVLFEVLSQDPAARRDIAAGRAGGGQGGVGYGRGVSVSSVPTRWRVLASGSVERSTNGGQSWEPIPIDPAVRLTAGSAPSPLVCWLVGPQGVILMTSDGIHFGRVPFPESTDLVSISANDAQHATVTTADSRAFTTADGGASWRAGRE
jgi:hypothetical protein